MTDHRVLRDPSREPTPNAEPPTRPDAYQLFDDPGERIPADERARALGLLAASLAIHSGDRQIALRAEQHLNPQGDPPAQVIARFRDDPAVLKEVGMLLVFAGRSADAEAAWHLALEQVPTDQHLLVRLATFYVRQREGPKGLPFAERLVRINPYQAEHQWLLSSLRELAGDRAGAIAAAEDALQRDPTALFIRQFLADAYEAAGRSEDQQAQQRAIRALQPERR